MPAELGRLKRRMDWLETLMTVLDSQLRTQGLRIELYLEECEPTTHEDRESKIRDAMGRTTRGSIGSCDCCTSSNSRKVGATSVNMSGVPLRGRLPSQVTVSRLNHCPLADAFTVESVTLTG